MQWVEKIPALEVLNLYDTHVTDKGLAGLASLKKLRRVYVWRANVTDAGIAALRKQLPRLDIVRAEAIPHIPAAAAMSPAATRPSPVPVTKTPPAAPAKASPSQAASATPGPNSGPK